MSDIAHEPSMEPNDESLATVSGGGSSDDDLLAALADDFGARLRRQEHPRS